MPHTLTVKQIVLETLAYYQDHPRATDGRGQCRYLTENGAMCAIGRCLLDPKQAAPCTGAIGSLLRHSKTDTLDHLLKPEYRGHDEKFWRHLQYLHDQSDNWFFLGEGEDARQYPTLKGKHEYLQIINTFHKEQDTCSTTPDPSHSGSSSPSSSASSSGPPSA